MAVVIKAKIYKIVSDKGEKCYIGSTTKQYLSTRWNGHKSDYRHKPINCASKELFDEYGMDHCRCELIEEVEYKAKEDYLIRERYWIENTPHCINQRRKPIASTTEQVVRRHQRHKEHYEERKTDPEYMANRRRMTKEWREKNHEPVQCECGQFYSVQHKARHMATKRHETLLRLKQLESTLSNPQM